jgi:alpha-N-arabinofuranosidase
MNRSLAKQHAGVSISTIAISILLVGMATRGVAQITVVQPIPPTATIVVHADVTSGPEIPRTIFGTFLEPIGNSTYNGLWAELLQNPSFESGLWSAQREAAMLRETPQLRRASQLALTLPWLPLDARQGNRYEMRYGDAANSWQSLRIFNVPVKATGIRQRVYLPIQRTREFTGSFYSRHVSGDATITVGLRLPNQTERTIPSHNRMGQCFL